MIATEPPKDVTITIVKRKTNPEWLKWKRQETDYTQAEIAERAGVSPTHISNIECGLTVCSERILALYKEL